MGPGRRPGTDIMVLCGRIFHITPESRCYTYRAGTYNHKLDAFPRRSNRLIFCAMSLTFEWDEEKAAENLAKHGVSFAEASTVFADPLSRTIPDPLHSDEEDRFVILGESTSGHTLVVVHTYREENIRIISARRATPRERKDYERGTE